MNIKIIKAQLHYEKKEGYTGFVHFEVEGHKAGYELTLMGKHRDNWSYSLNFLNGPGVEAQINEVETQIETNDELFDQLVDAALDALEQHEEEA
ncbi:hypothetical protein [Paenibacillus sp. GCM10027626]|uniref:hypothetical protein n=1 Tax=Paenibacillus sp. GCM10027626 TaxID=3273411 RepID=UPI003636D34C